ncbi:hypothetical protein GCM10010129_63470 [Streptomyces fumigatiscleroticus]|nr:hypothetical protein GCM10010129_63470 [Streptomyces fumigatiscleroticus]
MSLHSTPLVRRLAIVAAVGALAATAAVAPAAATDDWGDGPGDGPGVSSGVDPGDGDGVTSWAGPGTGPGDPGGPDGPGGPGGPGDGPEHGDGGHHGRHLYKGVVTADTLALRTAPSRGARIIRYASRGEVVSIYCKTGGDPVKGNPLWYLLTDGTWAWGTARHIDNIGPAPRWC